MKPQKKILTYGTFDLFHIGHARLFKRLKSIGDYLIVGVSTDEFNLLKGKKSTYSFTERKEIVESIKYVDLVIPENSWEQKIEDIKKYNSDILAMGDDWSGKFDNLSPYTEVIYLPRTEGISTTNTKQVISQINEDKIIALEYAVENIQRQVKRLRQQ